MFSKRQTTFSRVDSLDYCQVDQLDELFRSAPTPTEQESSNADTDADADANADVEDSASEKKEL